MKSNEVIVGQLLARKDRHKRLCIAMCLSKSKSNMKFLLVLEYFDNLPTILYSNVFISYKNWDDKDLAYVELKPANKKQLKEILIDIFDENRKSKTNKKELLL